MLHRLRRSKPAKCAASTWREPATNCSPPTSTIQRTGCTSDVFLKEQGPFDSELIAAIRRARAKGIPVVFGFNDVSEGKPVIAPGFADAVSGLGLLCVGTQLGYARLVPLVLNPREQKLAPLSLLTAHGAGTIEEVRAGEAGVRDAEGKTRWVGFSTSHTVARPPNDCPAMPEGSEYAGLILRLSPLELLRAQRWPLDTVLTGSADQFKGKIAVGGVELPQDRIEVARGLHREVRYGYELHADAVNNLLQGVSVRPLGTGAQFLLMLIMAALAGAIRLGAPRARGAGWLRSRVSDTWLLPCSSTRSFSFFSTRSTIWERFS
jgi:hypothetical protein